MYQLETGINFFLSLGRCLKAKTESLIVVHKTCLGLSIVSNGNLITLNTKFVQVCQFDKLKH